MVTCAIEPCIFVTDVQHVFNKSAFASVAFLMLLKWLFVQSTLYFVIDVQHILNKIYFSFHIFS